MSIKTISRALVLILALTFALSICSCAEAKSVTRDIPRVIEFTETAVEISKLTDPEEMMTQAETLIHPKSGLTIDLIIEKAKADEAFEGLDIAALASKGYSIGQFSEPQLKLNDPELGGNIYVITVNVILDTETFVVTVYLLSDEDELGLYDFDITKA